MRKIREIIFEDNLGKLKNKNRKGKNG